MLKVLKVDKLAFVFEDLNNFLLEKSYKLRDNSKDLEEDLTLYIFFFFSRLGPQILSLAYAVGHY